MTNTPRLHHNIAYPLREDTPLAQYPTVFHCRTCGRLESGEMAVLPTGWAGITTTDIGSSYFLCPDCVRPLGAVIESVAKGVPNETQWHT